jgi:hypothetical protein
MPQTFDGMSTSNIVGATFDSVRYATGAVDWFRNQGTDPDAITIMALPPGGRPRPTQAGDNQRADLSWYVSVDLDRAPITRQIAVETMKREGGKISPHLPMSA